jgi:hypothetical protein
MALLAIRKHLAISRCCRFHISSNQSEQSEADGATAQAQRQGTLAEMPP